MPRPQSPTPLRALVLGALIVTASQCGVGKPEPFRHPLPADDSDEGFGGAATSGATQSVATSTGSTPATTTAATTTTSAMATTVTTGGGAPDECQPDADDVACVACAKEQCCDEVQDCADDATCSCWIGCMIQNQGAIDLCISQCGAPNQVLLGLLDCSGDLCEVECDGIGL